MYNKALLIVNPNSGKKKPKNTLSDVINEFNKNNFNLCVYVSKNKQDTINTVMQTSDNYDIIICYGGDGTFNNVVTGITFNDNRPLLGYIPAGTTNDIALSLGLSKNNVQAAKDIILGAPFYYDLGVFNDKKFLYIAAFGFLTGVSYTTPQSLKNIFGRPAYFLESIKQLTNIKSYHVKIKYDEKSLEGDFIFGSISNSTSIAGAIKLKETKVKFDDGLFEVLLIKKPKSILEFINIITNLSKQNLDDENIIFFQTSNLKISSDTDLHWCLDGEDGGYFKNADILNMQKDIKLIINKKTSV